MVWNSKTTFEEGALWHFLGCSSLLFGRNSIRVSRQCHAGSQGSRLKNATNNSFPSQEYVKSGETRCFQVSLNMSNAGPPSRTSLVPAGETRCFQVSLPPIVLAYLQSKESKQAFKMYQLKLLSTHPPKDLADPRVTRDAIASPSKQLLHLRSHLDKVLWWVYELFVSKTDADIISSLFWSTFLQISSSSKS